MRLAASIFCNCFLILNISEMPEQLWSNLQRPAYNSFRMRGCFLDCKAYILASHPWVYRQLNSSSYCSLEFLLHILHWCLNFDDAIFFIYRLCRGSPRPKSWKSANRDGYPPPTTSKTNITWQGNCCYWFNFGIRRVTNVSTMVFFDSLLLYFFANVFSLFVRCQTTTEEWQISSMNVRM